MSMSPSSGCGYTVIDDDNIQFAIKEDEDVGVNPVSDDDFENIMNEFEQLANVLQSKEIKKGIQLQRTDQVENSDMTQLADFESIANSYENKLSLKEHEEDNEQEWATSEIEENDRDKIASQIKDFEHFAKSYEKKSKPEEKRKKQRARDNSKRNCKACGQELKNYKLYLLHIKKVHDGKVKHEIQSKEERKKKRIERYNRIRNCKVCGQEFRTYSQFLTHVKKFHEAINHEKLKKRYNCDECDYKSKTKFKLKNHINCVHKNIQLSCDTCEFTCKSYNGLKAHKNYVHDGINYPCKICPYIAKIAVHLKQHIAKIHDKIKKFSCDLCSYRSSVARDLNIHKQGKHEGEKFTCDLCPSVCTTAGGLMRHKVTRHQKK